MGCGVCSSGICSYERERVEAASGHPKFNHHSLTLVATEIEFIREWNPPISAPPPPPAPPPSPPPASATHSTTSRDHPHTRPPGGRAASAGSRTCRSSNRPPIPAARQNPL